MSQSHWFSAKCLFCHGELSLRAGKQVYEERVVLFRAADFDEAMRLAEAEARQYAADLQDVAYLGYIDVFMLDPDEPGHEAEVYSLMRSSELEPEAFIARYHDDGTRHSTRKTGPAANGNLTRNL